jgi:hypothetical protein
MAMPIWPGILHRVGTVAWLAGDRPRSELAGTPRTAIVRARALRVPSLEKPASGRATGRGPDRGPRRPTASDGARDAIVRARVGRAMRAVATMAGRQSSRLAGVPTP